MNPTNVYPRDSTLSQCNIYPIISTTNLFYKTSINPINSFPIYPVINLTNIYSIDSCINPICVSPIESSLNLNNVSL